MTELLVELLAELQIEFVVKSIQSCYDPVMSNTVRKKYFITSRHLILSGDLNYSNTLFGGILLQWIDEAASLYCIKQMNSERIVTLKLSEMMFKTPGLLSDMLVFYCRTLKEGNSSIHVELHVCTEAIGKKPPKEICHCELVFVAVDKKGKPTPWTKLKSRMDWQKSNFSYLPSGLSS